jgi:hypothetical protein
LLATEAELESDLLSTDLEASEERDDATDDKLEEALEAATVAAAEALLSSVRAEPKDRVTHMAFTDATLAADVALAPAADAYEEADEIAT